MLKFYRQKLVGAENVKQPNPVAFARTASLDPVPKKLLVQMRFKMPTSFQTATSDSTIATFFVGSNFADDVLRPSDSNIHSLFSIRTTASNSSDFFRLGGSTKELTTLLTFVRVSMVINNSDAPFNYTFNELKDKNNPNGLSHTGTVAPDTYDLWVDFDPNTTTNGDLNYSSVFETELLINDGAATTPNIDITNFKFIFDPSRKTELQILELYIRSIEGYLPVELLYFNGQVTDDQKVLLNWATATEKQSSHFLIQRSKDLKTYTDVAKVKAAGNSASRLAYSLTDEAPLKGTSYYRLIQVDLDGSEHPYRPVAVRINDDSEIEVYPNPSNGESIHVRVANPEATVQMHSMSGMPVSVSAVRSASDEFTLTPSGPLAQGVYIVTVTTPESTQRKKLVIR
ncbi:MAG: T9SS type A sorting domain-containing protein [Spirosomataceae bacterium]